MPMLRAPGAPVTSASPMVIMTASTLPAAKAPIDGVYSNHSSLTSTPASLNHPFWFGISNAVQPGQSLNAILSGAFDPAAGAGSAASAGRRESNDEDNDKAMTASDAITMMDARPRR